MIDGRRPGQPSASTATGDVNTVMRVDGVSKSYEGTFALRDVSLTVRRGEIHSIVGGNGSGKSTLIRTLAGVQPADAGFLYVDGEEFDLRNFSPALARKCGLHVVHQHRTTFGALTVAENLSLGRGFETGPLGNIHWRATRRRTMRVIERFGIRATPDSFVHDLGPADQTMLEIARALQDQEGRRDGVLLLDEPTASLPTHEVELLLKYLREFAEQGQAVIFISHRLDEVVAISDRVSVLRDGNLARELPGTALSRDAIVEVMVGQLMPSSPSKAEQVSHRGVVLEARGLTGGRVVNADLRLREGEIVGVAGLAGSGRSTLLRLIFGVQPLDSGTVHVEGEHLDTRDPYRTIRAGVAMVPEDRAHAAFTEMSLVENLTAPYLSQYVRWGRISRSREVAATRDTIKRFLVKAASPFVPIRSLSGGNQQKVMIARWLSGSPKVLILDEPTQGVDVRARIELWGLIQTAARNGLSLLLVSSDLEELVQLSTRILIMRDGHIASELVGPQLSQDDVNAALHALDIAA